MPHVKRLAAKDGILLAKAQKRTPLEFLLGVGNGDITGYEPDQFAAMVAAAPYCHARLAAVAVQQMPDASAERRKSMLAGLSYQQRQAIAGILATADVLEDGGDEADTPVVVEQSEDQKR